MSETLHRVKLLVREGSIRVSEHGYDELANDGITVKEVVNGIDSAMLIEDYPAYPKGPCVLVLQEDKDGNPIHAVWGIPRNHIEPVVLVTAYRPDPKLWDEALMRRKK